MAPRRTRSGRCARAGRPPRTARCRPFSVRSQTRTPRRPARTGSGRGPGRGAWLAAPPGAAAKPPRRAFPRSVWTAWAFRSGQAASRKETRLPARRTRTLRPPQCGQGRSCRRSGSRNPAPSPAGPARVRALPHRPWAAPRPARRWRFAEISPAARARKAWAAFCRPARRGCGRGRLRRAA